MYGIFFFILFFIIQTNARECKVFSDMKQIKYTSISKPILNHTENIIYDLQNHIEPYTPYKTVLQNVKFYDNIVPDFFYQSFVISKELYPKTKIGYSDSDIIYHEHKFLLLKNTIEHMMRFIEPVFPDFIGFIIEDKINTLTLIKRMETLKLLNIKTHLIVKSNTQLKELQKLCKEQHACDIVEYRLLEPYIGKDENVLVEINDNIKEIKLGCKSMEEVIQKRPIIEINLQKLPLACKHSTSYEFYLKHEDCKKHYAVHLDKTNIESTLEINNENIDIFLKPDCVYVNDNHYKYTADVRVDIKNKYLAWSISNTKSTCTSNYICSSTPCLSNVEDTVTVTSKNVYKDKSYAKNQTFTIDFYKYNKMLGVQYLYSKTLINDIYVQCNIQHDEIDIHPDVVLNSWVQSGKKTPKILQKDDVITISLSMQREYNNVNLNINSIRWTLKNRFSTLNDRVNIESHCEPCGRCMFNGHDMGTQTDIVPNIILNDILKNIYQHNNIVKDLKLILDIEASISFCGKRRKLLEENIIVSKQTTFDIDIHEDNQFTLIITGNVNIFISVVFTLFIIFACVCFCFHQCVSDNDRKKRNDYNKI